MDCLLHRCRLFNGVIIGYKCGCVVIKDNNTLKSGVATISDLSMCNRIISVLDTITIPGCAVQLLDVSLPDEAMRMGLSNIMVEPGTATNIPKHVLVARSFSPVFNDNHAVIQVMNISRTAVTIYSNAKLGEFTP